ncbi:unnamed protein product [Oncorhynchus mykiss]|uniref:Threonylcarbamoyl-AMP synthase n=1 Tax=Oncorhynchus mykiss TaxID=8022 RepID=A0A060YH04_ONCMY|nr:unnamed protein product [Oncorhynchus mykiss]
MGKLWLCQRTQYTGWLAWLRIPMPSKRCMTSKDVRIRNHWPFVLEKSKTFYKYCKVSVKKELIGDLLPGPVTLVLERAEVLNTDLNPFTPLVVVCIPDQAFMRRLCQMCREPLAVTSANISPHSSTVAVHDFQDLWPQLSVVVDGGPIGDKSRLGSTGKYRIIRPGCAFSSTVHVLEHKYGLSEDTG